MCQPAGVGIGRKPPTYLKSGDEVTVSATGLGQLTNRIANPSAKNNTHSRVERPIQSSNIAKAVDPAQLTVIGDKPIYYRTIGSATGSPVVFVHGLGGTSEFWSPLIAAASLESSHSLHLFDFEGHGLTPTSPLSTLSIASFAKDLEGIFSHANISSGSGAILIAHSMGCLVATKFVLENPGLVRKLILLGPPPSPLPEAASQGSYARAKTARTKGMAAVYEAVASAGTSTRTKRENAVALAAVRISLLGQDPEGYAKACTALAGAITTLDFSNVQAETLIITGDEDKVSPPQLCEGYSKALPKSKGVQILQDVGHWHVFEDVNGVAKAVKNFL